MLPIKPAAGCSRVAGKVDGMLTPRDVSPVVRERGAWNMFDADVLAWEREHLLLNV